MFCLKHKYFYQSNNLMWIGNSSTPIPNGVPSSNGQHTLFTKIYFRIRLSYIRTSVQQINLQCNIALRSTVLHPFPLAPYFPALTSALNAQSSQRNCSERPKLFSACCRQGCQHFIMCAINFELAQRTHYALLLRRISSTVPRRAIPEGPWCCSACWQPMSGLVLSETYDTFK